MSLKDSLVLSNQYSLDNAVYKASQKPEDYIAPSITLALP
jgi:hypothetical protein